MATKVPRRHSAEALANVLGAFWGEDTPSPRDEPKDHIPTRAELLRAAREDEESREADKEQKRRIEGEEEAAYNCVVAELKKGDKNVGFSEDGTPYRDSGPIRHYGRYARG